MTDDPRKRSWLELLERIKRGMTATSHGPMFVASPRDISLLNQMAQYIERSELIPDREENENGDAIQ